MAEEVALRECELEVRKSAKSVENNESIVRFLFYPQMIDDDGKLLPIAFPVDELIEKSGKSFSSTRKELAESMGENLRSMCIERGNPEKGRAARGHLISSAMTIRRISDDQDSELKRIFVVLPDPVPFKDKIDLTHSKVRAADIGMTKSYIRGFRDKLVDAFSDFTVYKD